MFSRESLIWENQIPVSLPIQSYDIDGFKEWVNWNGYERVMGNHAREVVKHPDILSKYPDLAYSDKHEGFDFATYINEEGNCIVGLPPKTPVRAIADGVVQDVVDYGGYMNIIKMKHMRNPDLRSWYGHIMPLVEVDTKVKRDDIIGELYAGTDEGVYNLVHLHFEVGSHNLVPWQMDPVTIFPEINGLVARPQDSPEFVIDGLNYEPKIIIANFKKLRIGGFVVNNG